MENEKLTNEPEDTSWLDDLFKDLDIGSELEADETAMAGHDMSQLADRELNDIMREAMSSDWESEAYVEEPVPVFDTEDAQPQKEEDQDEYLGEYGNEYADEVDPENEEWDDYEEEEPFDPDMPVRKVRPKRKKGYGLFGIPHLVSTAIWLVIAVSIGISLGRLLWICATDVLAFGRPDQNVTITINEHDTVDSITNKLYDAGLIKYKELFKLYAALANADEKISVGTFTLNTQYDYHALVGGLSASSSYRETVEVVIPEGYSCAQIFALLEKKGVCSATMLEAYASTSEFSSYWFLEGVEKGTKYCLEGFLFPDTYEFYTNDTPQRIFHKFLSRFDDQFDEELVAHIDVLNEKLAAKMRKHGYGQSYIEENKMTLHDVVIMASIVQKESAHSGENYDVASVFYNRLCYASKYPWLNSDATVVYAHGGKQDLTKEDYKLDSPYNTYVHKGLPVGPIANPGLSALMAALNPSDTDYYYFVLDPSIGEHLFSKTEKEHQDKVNSIR